jgi:NTP pyrophosphatase (non-canonical NTP hydrolase)
MAQETAKYPRVESVPFFYPVTGLAGETGEVCEKVKKLWRDHGGIVTPEFKAALAKELGDVLWYLSAIATDVGLNLGDIAQGNIDKLRARRDMGLIHGNGDDREEVFTKPTSFLYPGISSARSARNVMSGLPDSISKESGFFTLKNGVPQSLEIKKDGESSSVCGECPTA